MAWETAPRRLISPTHRGGFRSSVDWDSAWDWVEELDAAPDWAEAWDVVAAVGPGAVDAGRRHTVPNE